MLYTLAQRNNLTDRLGLPRDATNAQIRAALDGPAPQTQPATSTPAEAPAAAQTTRAAEDELMRKAGW